MSPSLSQLKKWAEKNRAQIKKEYFEFLRFQSISTDRKYEKEVRSCASWLREYIEKYTGMKSECIETEGYPLVYAENLHAGKGASTMVLYGHYDVQPVDPLDLWKSPPFEPTERNGLIYARGASDDKGQIFYAILAVRCWKELGFKLPINLKFCIEGEEESASVGLSKSLPKLKEKLKGDYLLVVDFGSIDSSTPAITLGARGLAALEVTLTGSTSDLHSGSYGGIAYNPNRALAELLAKIWDEKNKIRIPGFYDDIVEMDEEEKESLSFEKERYSEELGIDVHGGEKDRTLKEANYLRPTLEINGMFGGYTGPGTKTVIPAKATAKITCRLVPNQDPQKVARKVEEYLKKHVVQGMKIKVEYFGGECAYRGNPESKLAKAIMKAASEVTGKQCVKILSGGSIPIISQFVKITGAEVIGMGYALPSDNVHAPNENFDLDRFEKGFLTVSRTFEFL